VDKGVQRTLAAEVGIAGPDFRVVPPSMSTERVGQLAAKVGFPVVLKPARGSRSRGIQAAASYEELISVLSFQESTGDPFVGVVEELLLDDPARNPTFASYVP
jgi:biotin carboxylase